MYFFHMKGTYCKTLAKQGGHGPGWQRSVHLWEHTFCWLSSWDDEDDELFFNGFPHTSPQEWGVSRRSYAGSITFPQKHRYSRGADLRTNWHPGHLKIISSKVIFYSEQEKVWNHTSNHHHQFWQSWTIFWCNEYGTLGNIPHHNAKWRS